MLKGLQNHGNTCFLNASLQALATCDTLQNTRTLGPFFRGMCEGRQMNAVGPRALVMRSFLEFRNSRQHDAHEWILRLLEVLEKDDEELVAQAFDGQFSVTVCFPSCGHINRHDEDFRTLSLDLPSEGGTLETAFASFGDSVAVESTCDEVCKEKERKRAVKAMRIKTLPRHLILHWKRFERRGLKCNRRIACPPTLEAGGSTYRLTGIVNHAGGTARSGHYTACALHGSQWFMANDRQTVQIEERHALKAAELGYVLVYNLV